MAGGDSPAVSTKREGSPVDKKAPGCADWASFCDEPADYYYWNCDDCFRINSYWRVLQLLLKSWSSSPSINEPREYSDTSSNRNKTGHSKQGKVSVASTGLIEYTVIPYF
jgi:hypothetical protein